MSDVSHPVRMAAQPDVPSLVALINAAYIVEAAFKRGDRTDAEDVAELMQKGRFLILEAEADPLGCVYVEVDGERGYFGMLSIHPSHQKRGFGRRLIEAAEAFCRRSGCARMELQVVNLRTELPPYYRRFGYVESGIREFTQTSDWLQPCHFIVMSKAL